MNLSTIAALVQKDILLYYKNKLFAFLTILMLVAYLVVFYLMPDRVDETLEVGWYAPGFDQELLGDFEEGLVLNPYASAADLQAAVEAGDEQVGIALPADFVTQLRAGARPQAVVYIQSETPDEIRGVYSLLLEEVSYMLAGQNLNITAEEVLLGPDMAGQQIPPRERMVPLLAVFLLMTETMGLAALLTAEIETGTIRALLATPLSVVGLFVSKGIAGIILVFTQIALVMLLIGGFRNEPVLLVVAFLLGALLVTGVAFLVSSVSRDMLTVIAWGFLAMMILAVPSFNILMPGLITQWVRVLPSYYLIDPVYRIMNFGAGFSDVWGQLLVLLAWALAFYALGVWSVRRRLA